MSGTSSLQKATRFRASKIPAADLLRPGARYHLPQSTYKKLFGGVGISPEQNLLVISADGESVLCDHDGQVASMERTMFIRLARKTIAAGAQFSPFRRPESSGSTPSIK